MSEETQNQGIATGSKYVVVAGFIGEKIADAETGVRIVHNRGDVVTVGDDISAETAQVEQHRNRLTAADAATVDAIRAQERESQGADATFAGAP